MLGGKIRPFLKNAFLIITFSFSLLLTTCKKAPPDAPEIETKITGRVTDAKTNQSLAGVTISTTPTTSSVITGQDGTYTIPNVGSGQYTVTASKVEYNSATSTVSVQECKTVTADIQLFPQGAELEVSTQTMDFGVSQSSMNFLITNKIKVGTVSWQVSANQTWIALSPSDGTTTTESDAVSVQVDRSSLDYGNYSGIITVNSDFGTQKINVLLAKQNPNAPQLTVAPLEYDFGSDQTSTTITIKNTGTGSMNWSLTKSDSWILASSTQGSLNSGDNKTITVTVDRSGLQQNDYEGNVTINSNGGMQIINIRMKVLTSSNVTPIILGTPEDITYNSMKLKWQGSADPKFTAYKLYLSTTPDVTENSTLITRITDKNTTEYNVTNLTGSTTYYFRVYVENHNGATAGSNIVNAITERALGSWAVNITLSGINPTVNCLFPISDNNVWVVGDEIWHYNGNTWAKDLKPSGIGKLQAVYFSSSSEGWAVGENSTVIRHNGTKWEKISSDVFPTSGNTFYDVVSISENDVWIAGYRGFYHFDGVQWTKVATDYTIIDMDILPNNNIWALSNGNFATVFKYNGSGWLNVGEAGFCGGSKCIESLNDNDVWICGSDVNGGCGENTASLWHYNGYMNKEPYLGSSLGEYTNVITFLSANEGWRFTNGSLLYYNGTSWKAASKFNSITSIRMLSSKSGWAVTSSGSILRYKE